MSALDDFSPVHFSAEILGLIREIFEKTRKLKNISQHKCYRIFEDYSPDDAISFRQFYKIIHAKTAKKLNFLTARFLCKSFLGITVKDSRDMEKKLTSVPKDEIQSVLENADSIEFLNRIRKNNGARQSDKEWPAGRSGKSESKRGILRPYIVYGTVLLLLAGITYFIFRPNSNHGALGKIAGVLTEGKILKAIDGSGDILWQKQCEFKISEAFLGIPEKNDITAYPALGDGKFIMLFLLNPNYIPFNPEISISSSECDNRLVLLNNKGDLLLNTGLGSRFHPSIEFAPVFRVTKCHEIDLDKDGKLDHIFWITHHGMYPATFVFRKGLLFYRFITPGHLSDYRVLKADAKGASFLILGYNNPLAHLQGISEVNFIFSSKEVKIQSIGNITTVAHESQISGFLYFLPSRIKIINCSWRENGEITLFDEDLNSELKLTKEYKLTVKTGNISMEYQDTRYEMQEIYTLLDKFFKEKKLRKDINSAYRLIQKTLKYNIQNPFLKSALLYLKGDLEVEKGLYELGRQSLNSSLDLYSYNNDSRQRLCEIYFLMDEPLKSLEYTRGDLYHEDYFNQVRFWGLVHGKIIFQTYCYLQSGKFDLADQCTDGNKWPYRGGYLLRSISGIFRGDYSKVLKGFKENEGQSPLPFTVAERRVLYARVLLLKNLFRDKPIPVEINRAKFYFTDLAENSLSQYHLAGVSKAYFLAQAHRSAEAAALAKTSFDKLLDLSKGNMIVRLWLFYDAYIYGRTMEILGNRAEARRGYQVCIKANPHSDLAHRAKQYITDTVKQ